MLLTRERGTAQGLGQRRGGRLVQVDQLLVALALQRSARAEVTALGDPLVTDGDQPGGEQRRLGLRAGVQDGVDVPVGGGPEGHPLALTVDHQPGRDRLHAARRQPRHDLLPQHRGDLVAVQAVEDPSGLLGVDQVDVEVAGVGHGLGDGLRGDLVEHHPPGRHLRLQLLQQVPGDGLALAVLIGGQQELVGSGQGVLEGADGGALVRVDDVERLEVVVDVDARPRPLLTLVLGRHLGGAGRQVADVPTAGLDDVPVAQEAGDLRRLLRRLDDHQSSALTRSHAVLFYCLCCAVPPTGGRLLPVNSTGRVAATLRRPNYAPGGRCGHGRDHTGHVQPPDSSSRGTRSSRRGVAHPDRRLRGGIRAVARTPRGIPAES